MLQIGDIVHLKPFGETLYTITGVMRTPGPQYEPVRDPENDNRFTYRRPIVNLYAVDGGKCHWTEHSNMYLRSELHSYDPQASHNDTRWETVCTTRLATVRYPVSILYSRSKPIM